MTTLDLYHLALVGHIVGLTMAAGTTLVDYVILKQFWKQLAIDRPKGVAILNATSRFPLLFGIGFLLLIISGVTLMAITHGAFGEQSWFRIKMALVVILVINGVAVGRRQGTKLRKILSGEKPGGDVEERLLKLRKNINWFQTCQLALFLAIFILGVFKFN